MGKMADCGPLARGACDMTTLHALHARILSDLVEHGGAVDALLCVPPADQPGRTLAPAAALEALLERLGVAAGRRARRMTRSSLPTTTRLPS
jgi:hypothetical protein